MWICKRYYLQFDLILLYYFPSPLTPKVRGCSRISKNDQRSEILDITENSPHVSLLLYNIFFHSGIKDGTTLAKAIRQIFSTRIILFILSMWVIWIFLEYYFVNKVRYFNLIIVLVILILVSQRVEVEVVKMFGNEETKKNLEIQIARQRGAAPSPLEFVIVLYVLGFIWQETREV